MNKNNKWEGVIIKNYISKKEIVLGKKITHSCTKDDSMNENTINYSTLKRLLNGKDDERAVSKFGWYLKSKEEKANQEVCGYCEDCKTVFTFEKSLRVHSVKNKHENIVYSYREKIKNIINDNPFEWEEHNTLNIIYKIENLYNDYYYYGSSTRGKERWADHIYDLNRGKHCNVHLQAAWNKYNEKAFKFIAVEHLPSDYTAEQVAMVEQNYLDEHVRNNKCYNMSKVADRPDNTSSKKPVKQLTRDTRQLIKRWPSIMEAERGTGIMHGITATCKGRNASAGGFCWEFDDEEEAAKYTPNNGTHGGHGKKKVCLIDPFTYEIKETYDSLEEAAKKNNNGSYVAISSVCRGKRLSCNGLLFRYYEDAIKLAQQQNNNQLNNETQCAICGIQTNTIRALASHLQTSHKVPTKDYTVKYILNLNEPPKCFHEGCDTEPRYTTFSFKKYCKEHSKMAMKEGGKVGGKYSKVTKTYID